MTTAEARFAALGLALPPAPTPMGLYRPSVLHGGLLHLSGHGPLLPDGTLVTGRVGDTLTADQGRDAARRAGLAILATVRAALGSLDRVDRLVSTTGWVCGTADFTAQPQVLNGFSELMRQVFGDDRGVGVRAAVSAPALPGGMAVEVACVFAVAAAAGG